jgi:TolA-binding protein
VVWHRRCAERSGRRNQAKKEKKLYFASAVLLLAFALQGFLPTVVLLSASEPLTEMPTRSPTAGANQRMRQQDQLQQLQRDQQLNNLQQELDSSPMGNRDAQRQQQLDQNQRKVDQLKNERADRLTRV